MASISTDAGGRRRILFIGADGNRRAIRLGKMPIKAVNEIRTKVESLNAAAVARVGWERQTAEWVADLDAVLYDKLAAVQLVPKRAEPEKATLGTFLESYIAMRADVKGSTATVYGHTRRCLVEYFGAGKPLADISAGDADQWRIWLADKQGLAENTVSRRCGIAKQFFRAAVRKRLIAESPFADMKGCAVRGNKAREHFVSRDVADKVLDACPDAQWRLLFALSRYGGLRCPSEHLALRWGDVDWERNRLTIHSSKTEHHADGGIRVIPLFPEVRRELDALFFQAPDGEYIISRYRDTNINLRTQLLRIIDRAGESPWPKLFQNLRSTRETELAESYPIHVVCAWIGHTQAIAQKHYLQVTDEHFEQAGKAGDNATRGDDDATKKAAQNPAQPAAAEHRGDSHDDSGSAIFPAIGAFPAYYTNVQVGGEGLEPPTPSV